jgi:hypothetical protein
LRRGVLSLDVCLDKLRYVKYGDEARAGDVNTKVECLRALSSVFRQLGVDDPLVDELDALLSKIPYVKSGDIIQPEHHNYIVDALRKARDILSKMEEYYIAQLNSLASVSPFTGLGVGFGFSTYPDSPCPPSLPYAGSGLLTVEASYDSGYASPCTALVVDVPIYRPGYYISDGVS